MRFKSLVRDGEVVDVLDKENLVDVVVKSGIVGRNVDDGIQRGIAVDVVECARNGQLVVVLNWLVEDANVEVVTVLWLTGTNCVDL